jgi:hypothetical protein
MRGFHSGECLDVDLLSLYTVYYWRYYHSFRGIFEEPPALRMEAVGPSEMLLSTSSVNDV